MKNSLGHSIKKNTLHFDHIDDFTFKTMVLYDIFGEHKDTYCIHLHTLMDLLLDIRTLY